MNKSRQNVVDAVRVSDTDFGRVVGQSLRSLRELRGLTQTDLARVLKVGQASISKIEGRGDVHLSTLKRYVEALGASLRIDARLDPELLVSSQLEGAFDRETTRDDQLVFPIFGDEIFPTKRDVVLSVRPIYSEKILEGTKTVELRRRFPISAPPGTIAYIYATSPIRAMVGSAEIGGVSKLPVKDIWRRYNKLAQIKRADFDLYFDGADEGFAIHIGNVRSFSRPVDLLELRTRFGFEPPQSFLYATPTLRMALQHEYSDVSN